MEKNPISIEDAVWMDNKIWFCPSDYKILVSMDIESKEKKYFTIPSGGAYDLQRAFASMKVVGRKIFLIPYNEKVIMQFDVDTEEFCRIDIDDEIVKNRKSLFLGVAVYQNYLFVIGTRIPVIIRLNMDNNHIDYITDWEEKVRTLIFDSSDGYIRRQSVVVNGKLYVPFCNANAVLEIDCVSMKTYIHSMGEERQGYSGICFDGKFIWLSPRKNGSIVKWDIDTKQISKIALPLIQRQNSFLPYIGIVSFGNEIHLLSSYEKPSNVYDEVIHELCGALHEDEKNIILYDKEEGIFTLINKVSGKQLKIELGKYEVDIAWLIAEKGRIVVEKQEMGIQQLIKFVTMEK